MRHVIFFGISICLLSVASAEKPQGASDAPTHVDHRELKEPVYQSMPKYSLMTFGKNAEVKVWMVEVGERLFIDKNANGDLTDDGPPIEPSNVRAFSTGRRDFNYTLDAITPISGSRHTNFDLRRWCHGEEENRYGLSISVEGLTPMYAGWFGSFWSSNRETAPVIHFGGPFKPVMLRRKEFKIGGKQKRLSLGFFRSGSGAGAESRLSIDAIAASVVPILQIEWPTDRGVASVKTSHLLKQRCCYWEFYTTEFKIPKGVIPGKAKVLIELPSEAIPAGLTTIKIQVPVIKAFER